MELHELVPDADVLISMEPEELGLLMLKTLATCFRGSQGVAVWSFVQRALGTGANAPFAPPYPAEMRREAEQAIREAWAWLQGSALLVPINDANLTYFRLSRKAWKIGQSSDPTGALRPRALPRHRIHAAIRDEVWALFHREKYDTAVFEAMKAVEVAVRDAAGLPSKDVGTTLMRKAFDPETGALTDLATEKAEREARSALFAGAIGSYKNPHSHRYVELSDPDEAAEIILLASHLLRIVDAQKIARAPA